MASDERCRSSAGKCYKFGASKMAIRKRTQAGRITKASTKKASTKKASTKKASAKKASTKKASTKKASTKKASAKKKHTRKQVSAKKAAPRAHPRGKAYIALLRGINVSGHKRVPMAELRELAHELGCERVESYIQSGNLVVQSPLSARELEAALEKAIVGRFGFSVDVVVRSSSEWERYAAGSPFADAEAERPHLLHLGLSKRKVKAGAVRALAAYAQAGERIQALTDGLWIDFSSGVARSKLTPQVLDRVVGSTVTARNFRTVLKLAELAKQQSK